MVPRRREPAWQRSLPSRQKRLASAAHSRPQTLPACSAHLPSSHLNEAEPVVEPLPSPPVRAVQRTATATATAGSVFSRPPRDQCPMPSALPARTRTVWVVPVTPASVQPESPEAR